jgi:lipid-A-disaccharide synthase
MKIYLIAGEPSGDFIGSKLIGALRARNSAAQFEGVGGELMKQEGLSSLFPVEQISLMGFWEIIPHIPRLKKLINKAAKDVILKNPEALITIDSPGFTYRVAKEVKKLAPHIKLIHVVAPSVWAYKPGRAQKYADLYDHMLTLLPFEPKYFTEIGLDARFIGHPVLEQSFYKDKVALRKEMKISNDVKIIAITPGSRKGEISRHMPVISMALERLAAIHNIHVIFVQRLEGNIENISSYLSAAKFSYTFSADHLKAFAACDCALAKSGTNILEIAASGTPMIVGYKLHPLSFWLLKMMIKVKYAGLINIIAGQEIIPEYIQSDFNVSNIVRGLSRLLSDKEKAAAQAEKSTAILHLLGLGKEEKPSSRAAGMILEMVKSNIKKRNY